MVGLPYRSASPSMSSAMSSGLSRREHMLRETGLPGVLGLDPKPLASFDQIREVGEPVVSSSVRIETTCASKTSRILSPTAS